MKIEFSQVCGIDTARDQKRRQQARIASKLVVEADRIDRAEFQNFKYENKTIRVLQAQNWDAKKLHIRFHVHSLSNH